MILAAPTQPSRRSRVRASSMRLLSIAALLSAAASACAFRSAHAGCSDRAAIGEQVIVEGEMTRRSDSTVTIAICMDVPAARRVGSYHGELTFSSTDAKVVGVTKPAVGIRVENVLVPGRVTFAGALSEGAGSGELLTVVLRTAGHGDGISTRLRMLEINDAAGKSLLPLTRVDSVPAATKTARSSTLDDPESRREVTNARWRQRATPNRPIGIAFIAAKAGREASRFASARPGCPYFHELVLRNET